MAALGTLTSGCCISRLRAAEISAELRQQNIERAEPDMRRAALQHGAELLPDPPQAFGLTPWCSELGDAAPRRDCVLRPDGLVNVTAGSGDTYRVLDHAGNQRVAIALGMQSSTTRLARRATTFFLLTPEVTRRRVYRRTACECDGGPVIVSMSGFMDLGLAFVVDDLPGVAIRRIKVPVVEEYIEWQCKAILV